MLIYHGTSQENAMKIMCSQLMCRKDVKVFPTSLSSNGNAIYLTPFYGPHYAFLRSSMQDNARGAILEIDTDFLDETKFIFDEITLEQNGRNDDGEEDLSIEERMKFYISLIETGKIDHIPWTTSLALMGSCAYRGSISNQAVVRVAVVDLDLLKPLMFRGVPPIIDTFNHRIMSHRYDALTKWIFGDLVIGPSSRMWEKIPFPPANNRNGITIYEQKAFA
tara:strand:- start:20731 stop:21393 length:663 start_codon:yes stop_codon:yes gene_type:complete